LAKPNEEVWASMLSEDEINASLMLSLKENLLQGNCKRARNINQKCATALQQIQKYRVIHVQKKVGRHKQPLPEQVKC
jgi:hypothetical protein